MTSKSNNKIISPTAEKSNLDLCEDIGNFILTVKSEDINLLFDCYVILPYNGNTQAHYT